MSIIVDAAVSNNMGRVRSNNEDNYYFNGLYMPADKLGDGGLFHMTCRDRVQNYAVCDGMGGVDAGEEAALGAVTGLGALLKDANPVRAPEPLCDGLQRLSDRLYEAFGGRDKKPGTTFAMLSIAYEKARAFNVGDSRVYMMRGGALSRLSTDHSEVARMISMGVITEEQARTHPKRHMISQYLGMPGGEVRLSVAVTDEIALTAGDWFVLCSDGLTDMVADGEIGRIVGQAGDACEAAKALVQEALKNGGKDNVTVTCVRIVRVEPLRETIRLRRLGALAASVTCGSLIMLGLMLAEWIGRAGMAR